MPNKYVLLALLLGWVASLGGAARLGYDYRDGEVAQELLTHANAYLEAGRRNATFESAASLRRAKAAAEARAKASDARHQLEMELARDEITRNCRVGDATFRLLNDAINAANGRATPQAGRVNGTGTDAAATRRADSGHAGKMDQSGGGNVR